MLYHHHQKSVPILRIHLSYCSARNKWTNAIMNHILASRVNCHISCKKEGHLQNYSAVALATLGLISREWRSGAGCKSFMEHRNGSLSQLNISRRYWSGSLKHYLLLSAVCYWLEHFVGLFHCALYISIDILSIHTHRQPPPVLKTDQQVNMQQFLYAGFYYLWLQIILVTARTLHTITVQLWTMQICR